MAIYHCSIQSISRNEGRSSVAAAAYRAGDKLLDERLMLASDFTRKQGVEHSEIVLPKDIKANWALDRQMLWNAAEQAENRKDARVAREVEISLPHELNKHEHLVLTQKFSQALADQYKVAVDFAIHAPHDRSDERNTHAHILMTTREVTEQGLGQKSVFEKDTRWLLKNNLPTVRMQIKNVREQWADFANKALEEKGLNIRIDHRSFADQGIQLAPTQHVGVQADKMKQRGVAVERQRLHPEDAKLNAELLQKYPHEIFKVITQQKSVFTYHDIAKAVNRYTNNLDDFQVCMNKVMASPYLIELQPEQGKQAAVYSTHQQMKLEQGLMRQATNLAEQLTHVVSEGTVDQAIKIHDDALRKITGDEGLSDEQIIAIQAATSPERLAVIEGLAGAGKSTLLAAAKEAWQSAGFQVVGAALSGKAAEGLEEASGITSRTLASWEYSIKNGRDRLNDKTVFVIDEAGMVSANQLARFIERIEQSGGKLVLVGDSEQLQPINAGAPFREIAERVQTTGLVGIRRQKRDWQREASVDFAQKRTGQALATYAKHQRIDFKDNTSATYSALVRDYVQDCEQHPEGSRLVLAHRRRDVHQLNQKIRQNLLAKGLLDSQAQQVYQTNNGERAFAEGDRFIFLENDRELGVKNGMLGEVYRVRRNHILVQVEGKQEVVIVPTQEYTAFDHGYATTIHKSQGATVDRSFVLASATMDRHLSYVAMTRHREDAKLYVDQTEFENFDALSQSLSRGGEKKTTLDYQDPMNLDLPKRDVMVAPGRFENALNAYAEAYLSVLRQQALKLPVIETQKAHMQRAQELLAEARPGAAELLNNVLTHDQTAQQIASDLAGRARAVGLVQRMQLYQDKGQIKQSAKSAQAEAAAVKAALLKAVHAQRETPLVKPKPVKRLTDDERIAHRFTRAAYAIYQQKSQGLPLLVGQAQEYRAALQSLDRVKPELKDRVIYAIQSDPKTRHHLSEVPSYDRVRFLLSRIDAVGLPPTDKGTRQSQAVQTPDAVFEQERLRTLAGKIWDQAIPLSGTLAERYLRDSRGIQGDLNSDDVRFLAQAMDNGSGRQGHRSGTARPALVVPARDANHKITGVQQIYLDSETVQRQSTDNQTRDNIGEVTGSAVLMHAGNTKKVIFAQNAEIGASVAQANPDAHVYVSLDGIKNYGKLAYLAREHQAKEVIFAANNDGLFPSPENRQQLTEAAAALRKSGVRARIATPPLLAGKSETDFNDLLVAKGEDRVRTEFEYARKLKLPQDKSRDYSRGR